MRTLCVFSADPISAYVRKGEIKPRYFNPADFFDQVVVVSPSSDDRADDEVLRTLVGRADPILIRSGWVEGFSWSQVPRIRRYLEAQLTRLLPQVAACGPSVVRGYSPQFPGWLAVRAARELRVPSVVSVHANFDYDVRRDALARGEYRLFLANQAQLGIEREVLRAADLVIAAYEWPAAYARGMGATRVEVVYNKIDTTRFTTRPVSRGGAFTVLSVGRLLKERNPDVLVRAMQHVDGRLRLIGDGPLRNELGALATRLGVDDRVEFIASVPNAEIHEEYRKADVYAHATRYGGIHIPIFEAMASGLPLVVPKPRWESRPEIVADIAVVVDNTPKAFADALSALKADPDRRRRLGEQGRNVAVALDGAKMERSEADLYAGLIGRS